MQPTPNNSIMIVAGEASGDLHGANLVLALKKRQPGLTFCGMGGSGMRAAGVELLFDAAKIAVVGLMEVFSHLTDILAARQKLIRRLQSQPPSLLILIDYPDFNLRLAARAKKLNIPVFYYISPQVWAWRTGRVATIRRLVDRMVVILPFEKDFYQRQGVTVDFVGHPLLDIIDPHFWQARQARKKEFPISKPVIGILPGSRQKEIKTLLPIFLQAAGKLAGVCEPSFLMPMVPDMAEQDFVKNCLAGYDFDVRIVTRNRYEAMSECDAVMVASGTVTMELAIIGVPMVVAYRISSLTHLIAKRFIKVEYASLVNLVATRKVVAELLQYQATAENIFNEICNILNYKDFHDTMMQSFDEVRHRLGDAGASDRTAHIVLETLRV